MTIKIYQTVMALCEAVKPVGAVRNKYKIIRACKALTYYGVSQIENWLIECAPYKKLPKERNVSSAIVTASLTTFPARIKAVRYAIISLLLQTRRPDRIVLWLADEQFPNKQIPENVQDLLDYGLEVRFCDDLRSHKKYYYALQEQKENELVITFDDDIIYHPHTIERLFQKSKEYPRCIVCGQVRIMTFDEKGTLNPYRQWKSAKDGMDTPSSNNTPLTGSGCLYPFGVMPAMTFDQERIWRLAPTADDLWIGMMARLNGTLICTPRKVARIFSVVGKSQKESLSQVNCVGDGNDATMERMQQEFGNLVMVNE